jgi:hypothetical protein
MKGLGMTIKRVLGTALVMLLGGCGSNDDQDEPKAELDILDPSRTHYGTTYEELAGDWIQNLYNVAPPDCVNPVTEATGANCARYQDPDAAVFHLAGNYGGVTVRDECVVPAGKPLFFPLLNSNGDNAGVPDEMTLPDSELSNYAASNFELMQKDSLKLVVDGHAVKNLERGAIPVAGYSVTLEPDANIFTCLEIHGYEGEYAGYLSGYYALLAPLSPGAHTIAFGGSSTSGPQGQAVTIDVTYHLTVE